MARTKTQPQAPVQEDTHALPPIELDVRVRPIQPMGNLLGFASVNINSQFAVDGFKIVQGEKGLFVDNPSVKDKKGQYHDVCFPVTADFRKQLHSAILEGYAKTVDRLQAPVEKQSLTGQVKAAAAAKPAPDVEKKAPAKDTDAR